jgi:hypothetical protein
MTDPKTKNFWNTPLGFVTAVVCLWTLTVGGFVLAEFVVKTLLGSSFFAYVFVLVACCLPAFLFYRRVLREQGRLEGSPEGTVRTASKLALCFLQTFLLMMLYYAVFAPDMLKVVYRAILSDVSTVLRW